MANREREFQESLKEILREMDQLRMHMLLKGPRPDNKQLFLEIASVSGEIATVIANRSYNWYIRSLIAKLVAYTVAIYMNHKRTHAEDWDAATKGAV